MRPDWSKPSLSPDRGGLSQTNRRREYDNINKKTRTNKQQHNA